MAINAAPMTSLRAAKSQTVEAVVYPAPLQGMDARVPLASDSMNTCIWAINILPTEYAMRVRPGYREWQVGVGSEVRTIIPYIGDTSTGSKDRLFVATTNGIYDCTASAGTPTLKASFAVQSDNAGYGVYTSYVDESGDSLMFYADGENGLYRYDPDTDTWAVATGITTDASALGTLDVSKVNYVMVHKLRIWLIERDSNKAWYLPIRSAQGAAKEFFFAGKFRQGGELVGLYNWTVDGGAGRDDHLVAISRSGDVIPWTGEDPADSLTWMSTGTFFIGEVPRGVRTASEYGGELFLLSKFGITTMSSLLSGAMMADPYNNTMGHKISRLMRQDLAEFGSVRGWALNFVTNLGALVVNTPKRSDGKYRQYVYNIGTEGWGLWRDLPYHCGDSWKGALMLGDEDGRVLRLDQYRDNLQLTPGSGGDAINYFLMTNFSHLGAPAAFKRAKFVRPNFICENEPTYQVSVLYDYNLKVTNTVPAAPTATSEDVWDTGLWDDAIWSATLTTPFNELLGVGGIGRSCAISLVGAAIGKTDLVSFDVIWETGGLM